MSGRFLLPRGWMDDFRKEKFSHRDAYVWCVEQAAYEAHRQWFNGRQITVQRGEFVTSLRLMGAAFTWPVGNVQRFLAAMNGVEKLIHRIAYDAAQSPTIVTVCNYEQIQSFSTVRDTARDKAVDTAAVQSRYSGDTQQNKGNEGNGGNLSEEVLASATPTRGSPTRAHTHARGRRSA